LTIRNSNLTLAGFGRSNFGLRQKPGT